jgi:hypothetical protein
MDPNFASSQISSKGTNQSIKVKKPMEQTIQREFSQKELMEAPKVNKYISNNFSIHFCS